MRNELSTEHVARRFAAADAPDVVYGRGRYVSPNDEPCGDAFVFDDPQQLAWRLKTSVGLLQPAVFLRREIVAEVGGLDRTLHYAMDYDLWIRLVGAGARFAYLDDELALAVVHPAAKTQSMRGESIKEAIAVVQRHFGFVSWSWAMRQADWEITGRSGLTASDDDAETVHQIRLRAQQHFDAYNRNLKTIGMLARPPWDRATLSVVRHLVGRAT